MTKEDVATKIVEILDCVAKGEKDVRYTSFVHPNGRSVSIVIVSTGFWDQVKWALEEVFGKLEEAPKIQ